MTTPRMLGITVGLVLLGPLLFFAQFMLGMGSGFLLLVWTAVLPIWALYAVPWLVRRAWDNAKR